MIIVDQEEPNEEQEQEEYIRLKLPNKRDNEMCQDPYQDKNS